MARRLRQSRMLPLRLARPRRRRTWTLWSHAAPCGASLAYLLCEGARRSGLHGLGGASQGSSSLDTRAGGNSAACVQGADRRACGRRFEEPAAGCRHGGGLGGTHRGNRGLGGRSLKAAPVLARSHACGDALGGRSRWFWPRCRASLGEGNLVRVVMMTKGSCVRPAWVTAARVHRGRRCAEFLLVDARSGTRALEGQERHTWRHGPVVDTRDAPR